MVVNGFFNHFICLLFSDCVRCMPAAIMELDVMESYVGKKWPKFSSFTRKVVIRFKYLKKLAMRSKTVASPSRRSFQGTLGRW